MIFLMSVVYQKLFSEHSHRKSMDYAILETE